MTGTLLIAAVLLLGAAFFIAVPLILQQVEPYLVEDDSEGTSENFSERDALLEALSELEQDQNLGKVSPKDYESQKAQLEQRYVQVVEGVGGGGA